MAGEIIKVYNSRENAVAGGTTGQVVVGTVNSYGKIIESENRMLSSHYTVPRAHTLYIKSIFIE